VATDAGPGFEPDYGYLCDLAAVCGWTLGLARLDDGRFALRVSDGDEILGGVRFSPEASLDVAADLVFAGLHERGLV